MNKVHFGQSLPSLLKSPGMTLCSLQWPWMGEKVKLALFASSDPTTMHRLERWPAWYVWWASEHPNLCPKAKHMLANNNNNAMPGTCGGRASDAPQGWARSGQARENFQRRFELITLHPLCAPSASRITLVELNICTQPHSILSHFPLPWSPPTSSHLWWTRPR